MRITREAKDHIKAQLDKAVQREAEKEIPRLKKEHSDDYAELKKISAEEDASEKAFRARKNEVLGRISKAVKNSNLVEIYQYASDGEIVAKKDTSDLLNQVILKLQYGEAELSDIGKVIKEVLGA